MREEFSEVYRTRQWGEGSGPGSTPESLRAYHAELRALFHCLNVRTVIDLGCGHFGPHQSFYDDLRTPVDYTGVDCVCEVTDANQEKFIRCTPPRRTFVCADVLSWAVRGILPGAELCLAKDVLQHWPTADVAAFLEAAQRQPWARHLVLTNSLCTDGVNGDCPRGGYRPLDLAASPFFLPVEPLFDYVAVPGPEPDVKRAVLWEPGKKPWRGLRS